MTTCKILILAHHLTAHDSRFIKLLSSFSEAGFEVIAVTPKNANTHSVVTQIDRVSFTKVFALSPKLGNYLKARDLRKKLSAYSTVLRPDIIYAIDPEILPTAIEVKMKTGAHLIYDAHEFHEEEDPSHPERGAWVKKMELKAGCSLDTFITVNPSIKALYDAQRPSFPRALVVHNAINSDQTRPPYDGRLHTKAQLAANTHILLYQGNLSPMRGLVRLANVAKHLNNNWALVFMGDGSLKAQLDSLAASNSFKIIDPVPQQDLSLWTQGATIGAALYEDVGLNQHYCSPNKLWEYPHSGVPLLASNLPEIRRHVDKYTHGWLVKDTETPLDIAKRINALSFHEIRVARESALAFSLSTSWDQEIAPLLELLEIVRQKNHPKIL